MSINIQFLSRNFENERQWVDIAHPVLSRMTGTITELSKDKQIMGMKFSKWRMTVIGALEIDV